MPPWEESGGSGSRVRGKQGGAPKERSGAAAAVAAAESEEALGSLALGFFGLLSSSPLPPRLGPATEMTRAASAAPARETACACAFSAFSAAAVAAERRR